MATAPSDVNLEANQQGVTLESTIPFAIIAVIAVISRFVSRNIQATRYEFDDYMIVVALVFTLGCFTLSMKMVNLGSGKHLATVPVTNGPQYYKVLCIFVVIMKITAHL